MDDLSFEARQRVSRVAEVGYEPCSELRHTKMTQVNLARFDNSHYHPGRSGLWRALWYFAGLPLLRCEWITSSSIRATLLRLFGAQVGRDTVMRHGLKVKYPWHLIVGNRCWFGEGVWIDNLTTVTIGNDVCLSQAAYLCTGNHNWSDPAFGLIVKTIDLEDGAWAGARSILTPGVVLGRCAVAAAGSVIVHDIPDYEIHAGNPAAFSRHRIFACQSTAVEREVV
jgi:putative colanic acid biosynthesis acetyltransferase WcaF